MYSEQSRFVDALTGAGVIFRLTLGYLSITVFVTVTFEFVDIKLTEDLCREWVLSYFFARQRGALSLSRIGVFG